MHIIGVKTPIVRVGDDLSGILRAALPTLREDSVVVVTSKIIALCQGDTRPNSVDKQQLIFDECEQYILAKHNPFGSTLTITGGRLAAAAGIDESNAHGTLVLLPSKVQQITNDIRHFLKQSYEVQNLAVIVTDSRSAPLFLGTHGIALAYSGLEPLVDYRGKLDLDERPITISRLNVINAIAGAAVLAMGEGDEQIPIAVATDVEHVSFCAQNPTDAELQELNYLPDQDLYANLLASTLWQTGGNGYMQRQQDTDA